MPPARPSGLIGRLGDEGDCPRSRLRAPAASAGSGEAPSPGGSQPLLRKRNDDPGLPPGLVAAGPRYRPWRCGLSGGSLASANGRSCGGEVGRAGPSSALQPRDQGARARAGTRAWARTPRAPWLPSWPSHPEPLERRLLASVPQHRDTRVTRLVLGDGQQQPVGLHAQASTQRAGQTLGHATALCPPTARAPARAPRRSWVRSPCLLYASP